MPSRQTPRQQRPARLPSSERPPPRSGPSSPSRYRANSLAADAIRFPAVWSRKSSEFSFCKAGSTRCDACQSTTRSRCVRIQHVCVKRSGASAIQIMERRRGRIATKWSSISDTDYRWNLISPSPPHGQGTRGCVTARCTREGEEPGGQHRPPHPSRRSFGTARRIRNDPGSHLGSTLKPGRAVLTRGVFRRSRSVACIRADASPSEVLAQVHSAT